MKIRVLFILAALQLGTLIAAKDHPLDSPKEVIQRYLAMAADGALLESSGWYEANKLFVHQAAPPMDKSIVVVMDKAVVDESWVRANRAEETVTGYEVVGRITPDLRFTLAARPTAYQTELIYHLVLTDVGNEKQVKGEPRKEWKIENPPGSPWTTLTGAIRYVAQKQKEATNPIVKKHAEETLSLLRRYQSMLREPASSK